MLNKCYCATCLGVEAVIVTVEVDLSVGIGIHLYKPIVCMLSKSVVLTQIANIQTVDCLICNGYK